MGVAVPGYTRAPYFNNFFNHSSRLSDAKPIRLNFNLQNVHSAALTYSSSSHICQQDTVWLQLVRTFSENRRHQSRDDSPPTTGVLLQRGRLLAGT